MTKTKTSPIPSMEEMSRFAIQGRRTIAAWYEACTNGSESIWKLEDQLARAIGDTADAIVPLKGLDEDSVRDSGWSHAVWVAIRDAPGALDELAHTAGLGRMTAPVAERDAFREERVALWLERIGRPFYGAVMAHRAGFTATKKKRDVNDWAEEGRGFGCRATAGMNPDEGAAKWEALYDEWHDTARLGATLLRRDADVEERRTFSKRAGLLSAMIGDVEEELRRRERAERGKAEAATQPAATTPPAEGRDAGGAGAGDAAAAAGGGAADGRDDANGGRESPVPPFLCTKAEALEALGYSPRYVEKLDRLKDKGHLDWWDAPPETVSKGTIFVRSPTQQEREQFVAKIKELRKRD
jgi:hypothetical protein